MDDILNRYTLEELQMLCLKCYSFRQFALALGYSENSTNRVKKIIEDYRLDISHFKGQGWNKNNIDYSIFQYDKATKTSVLLRALTILRGWVCEKCGRIEWEGQRIPLCVHHIDGDHINNKIENLQVLCPNCHAQTDNYCGKNKRSKNRFSDEDFVNALRTSTSIRQALQKLGINYAAKYYYDKAHFLIDKYDIVFKKPVKDNIKKISLKNQELNRCLDCGKPISNDSKRCRKCDHEHQRRVEWPNKEELKDLIRNKSFLSIGKRFNVSDNTIRNWCKYYGLPNKKSEIKKYSDEEWSCL